MIAAGVGQAGNQILGLTARYTGPLVPPGRKQSGFAFIDSEPKVVRPLRTPGSPAYLPFVAPDSVAVDQNGRGNNWAWGYTGAASHRAAAAAGAGSSLPPARGAAVRADTLASRALAAIRRQAEAADRFDSLLLVHSLGGGTGSGLGSRVLELARDSFPDACLLSACIAPFDTGDTPLQWYNTALTLATAHEVADAVLLFDNGDLLARAGRLRAHADALFPQENRAGLSLAAGGGGGGAARYVSPAGRGSAGSGGGGTAAAAAAARLHVTDLNDVVAQCLAGLVLPTRHRGRLPHTTRAAQRAAAAQAAADADAAAMGRPAWASVVAPHAAGSVGDGGEEAGAFHNPYSEPAGEGDGSGEEWHHWFAGGGSSDGSAPLESLLGRPLTSVPFDALGFVGDLVPAPAYRYIDLRSAGPLQPHSLGRLLPAASAAASSTAPSAAAAAAAAAAAVSWVDLSEMLVETLPRRDQLERRVVTLTSTLIARGASQADCDAVDAALQQRPPSQGTAASRAAAAAAGSGRGGVGAARAAAAGGDRRPATPLAAAQQWCGLPGGAGGTSPDWAQVALRLSRAQAFSPALPPARQRLARLSPCPVFDSPLAPLRQPRSLTLASNSTAPLALLERTVQRVALQSAAGAYLHWYARFGVTREHIAVAAESVAEAADAYRGLL